MGMLKVLYGVPIVTWRVFLWFYHDYRESISGNSYKMILSPFTWSHVSHHPSHSLSLKAVRQSKTTHPLVQSMEPHLIEIGQRLPIFHSPQSSAFCLTFFKPKTDETPPSMHWRNHAMSFTTQVISLLQGAGMKTEKHYYFHFFPSTISLSAPSGKS